MSDAERFPRPRRRDEVRRVPWAVPGEPGLFTADASWGTVQPLKLHEGVETLGELELIDWIEAGSTVVDTRQPELIAESRIPGAIGIRHQEIVEGLEHLRGGDQRIALYCNGPQCGATPHAIELLIEAGWEPERLLYYRGGMHDWVTLGYPVETGD